MYVIKNAFRNISRNISRNILIGAIIFVIIVSSVVALIINNTTGSIIDDYKDRFGVEVILGVNMERIREETVNEDTQDRMRFSVPTISATQYITFGESDYLQSSLYTTSIGVNSDDMLAIDSENGGGMDRMNGMVRGMEEGFAPILYFFSLKAGANDEFVDGIREIAEGRFPESINEVIISTDLAELNNLSIGDSLLLTSHLSDDGLDITDENRNVLIDYEVTIVGTYYDASDEYSNNQQINAFNNSRNEILTVFETVVEPISDGLSGVQVTATYYLKSPEYLDAFAAEVYEKGLDPLYDVKTDEASYTRIVGPVEGLRSISITFMIVVLAFGGVIITLLSSIAIRERKYEIGVLRAMGMKKHVVALGLWSEMLIITFASLVLGLGIGTMVAQPVTDTLLAQQISAIETESTLPGFGGGMIRGGNIAMTNTNVSPLSEVNIYLSMDTILQIIVIAILLATFSAMIAVIRITKYEPIKILMERD